MIRQLHHSDIEAWSQLRVALHRGLELDEARREALQVLQEPDQVAFGAFDQAGVMIGFLEASLRAYADGCDSSPVGYIEGWYVLPEHRRRNVGRSLVQAAEDWARTRGCSEMASDVLLQNTISQQAHIRLGYEEVDRVVQYRKGL